MLNDGMAYTDTGEREPYVDFEYPKDSLAALCLEAAERGEDVEDVLECYTKEVIPYQAARIAIMLIRRLSRGSKATQRMRINALMYACGLDMQLSLADIAKANNSTKQNAHTTVRRLQDYLGVKKTRRQHKLSSKA